MAFLNQIRGELIGKLYPRIRSTTNLWTNVRNLTFGPQHEELRKTVKKVFIINLIKFKFNLNHL